MMKKGVTRKLLVELELTNEEIEYLKIEQKLIE
jgi:hypothetical protein